MPFAATLVFHVFTLTMITAKLHLYPKPTAKLRLMGLLDGRIIEIVCKSNLLILRMYDSSALLYHFREDTVLMYSELNAFAIEPIFQ